MSTDPGPIVEETGAAATPGPIAIFLSLAIAMFAGAMVFFGTCLGSTFVTMNYLFNDDRPWVIFVLWGSWAASGLVGLIVTFFVGRSMYRRAKRNLVQDATAASAPTLRN